MDNIFDVKINCPREASSLIQSRFGGAQRGRIRRTRLGAFGQIGTNHENMGMFSAATLKIETRLIRTRNAHSTPISLQAFSPPSSVSNIWMGAPGMMVEIACL